LTNDPFLKIEKIAALSYFILFGIQNHIKKTKTSILSVFLVDLKQFQEMNKCL